MSKTNLFIRKAAGLGMATAVCFAAFSGAAQAQKIIKLTAMDGYLSTAE